jgi:heme-degrading monooxygenase HmoA
MIARLWSAQATPVNTSAYVDHLKSQVLPALKKVDGYAGAMLLERPNADRVEILVITYWRSVDSIRGFAPNNAEEAVVAEEAASLLAQFDRRVRHYEVVVSDKGGRLSASAD